MPETIAEQIIAELKSRKGFEAWWSDIPEHVQLEIIIGVEKIIEK